MLNRIFEQTDKNIPARAKQVYFQMPEKTQQPTKYIYTVTEAAKFLGVSADTLRNWETAGKLIPKRTKGGSRRYYLQQLNKIFAARNPYLAQAATFQNPPVPSTPIPDPTTLNIFKKLHPVNIKTFAKPLYLSAGISLASLLIIGVAVMPGYLVKAQKTKNFFVSEAKNQAKYKLESSSILGVSSDGSTPTGQININIPSSFNDSVTMNKDLTVNKLVTTEELTASNIIYSITAGNGISVSSGQSPTITNTGVLSLAGKTGALTLTEGTDITIDGLKITNKSTLDTVRGRGGCSSCILDADVVAGLTISGGSVNDSPIGASTASTGAFTTLAASGATTLNGNITFTGSAASSIIPSANGSYDLGSSAKQWGTVYASNLSVSGVNSAGQLISTYVPTSNTVSTGPLYVNPTTATSGYTLAGFAVGGSAKLLVTSNGSLISGTDGSADLGSSSVRWNNLYVNTLTASGTNYSGQATFSYEPTSSVIGQGSIWINPTTATAARPLLSVSVGGTEKARITSDGYLGLNGANDPGSTYFINAGSTFNVSTAGAVTAASYAGITNSANLLFTKETAHTIQISDSTTANTAGAALTIVGAAGTGTGNGGAVNITGGATASGTSGAITLTSGAVGTGGGTRTTGNINLTVGGFSGTEVIGGAINLTAGNSSGSNNTGGAITLQSGAGANSLGTGGALNLYAGAAGGTAGAGIGGAVNITAGTGGLTAGAGGAVVITGGYGGTNTTSTGGAITLTSGAGGSSSGASGALTLATGTTSSGASGAIAITSGNATGGASGTVSVDAGTGTSVGAVSLGNTNATTVNIGGTAATAINIGAGGALSRTIAIGTGTGADTINIGTGGTGADAITIGNSASTTSLAFTSGTGSQTFTSSVVSTTGTSSAFVFNDAALTTGTLMYLQATAVTTGTLFDINTGSSIFSISNTALTTSLPTNFTSSGDVSIAYDINFTNPIASYIKSTAPLNITAGETFNSTNLTLQTYNQGTVVMDTAATTGTSMNLLANGVTTGTGLLVNANALTTGTAVSISSTSTGGTASTSDTLLNIARSGANAGATHTAYGIQSSVTNTGTTSVNVGGLFTATGATTNRGLEVAAMTGATSTGLTIGALSGTTANTGISIGAISGAAATGTGITIGNISTTGATNRGITLGTLTGGTGTNHQFNSGNITATGTTTNIQLNLGNISGTANGSANYGVNIGAISSAGTTTTNAAINISTLTGGTTANYQINTGILTSATTTTNAQINLGGVVTTGGTTNYGINVGALSGSGTTNQAVNIAAVTATGTSNYGLNIGGATGAGTTNYGLVVGTVSGATTNYGGLFQGTWFTGGTATTTKPQLLIEPSGTTTTGWSTSGTGLGVNAASGFAGNVMDLQLNGASLTKVTSGGRVIVRDSLASTATTAYGLLSLEGGAGGNSPVIGFSHAGDNKVYLEGITDGTIGIGGGSGQGTVLDINALYGSTVGLTATSGQPASSRNIALTITAGSISAESLAFQIPATTATITGGYATQRFNQFGQSTITAASALTVTTASTLNIAAAPTIAGSAVITNTYGLQVGGATTIAGAASSTYGAIDIPAHTVTTNTATQITSSPAVAGARIGQITIAQSGGAVTVDNAASLYIAAAPTAGASVTLTNAYALWVDAGTARFDGRVLVDATVGSSTAGLCWSGTAAAAQIEDCNGAPTDLAENFGTTDASIEAGDLVVIDNAKPAKEVVVNGTPTSKAYIKKATSSYQKELIGIVSTAPNQVYGTDGLFDDNENPRPVSLAGRVPLKVSTENGVIEAGDYLTSSSTPGVAMKATKPGPVVGKALESYSEEGVAKILVFVNVSYADPNDALANLSIDENGNLVSSKAIKTPDVILTEKSNSAADTNTNLKDEIASISGRLADLEARIATASSSEATSSGNIADLNLTTPDILLATGSATLANLTVTSEASFSAKLAAYDLTVSNIFKSLGQAVLGATTVAGDLTVDGTLSVSGDSISSIGTLYLQNGILAEKVDLFNGKVTIDKTGKLSVTQLEISSKTIGSAIIPANQLSITIPNILINNRSKVFVTPTSSTGGQALVVSQKQAGIGFTVTLDHTHTSNITFDWWIINETSE